MTKVKICGCKSMQDVSYMNEFLPEYVGFVFLEGKKRYVTPKEAKKMRKALDKRICCVGVFVNADVDVVIDLLKQDIIQMAQLHGQEDEEYIRKIQEKTGKPIIKACVIQKENDIKKAFEYDTEYILLDAGYGDGKTFDWSMTDADILKDKKIFLAGGLNASNVRKGMELFSPYAVDVSSSVETDGKKDKEKIRLFIEEVRR